MSKKDHANLPPSASRRSRCSFRRRCRALPAEPAHFRCRACRAVPDLGRGLRWGSILLGALGGLVSLLASLWLYDSVLALIAREDWIGWAAVGLLALVLLALAMIILREIAGLARLGRLGRIRHEADSAARQNDKPLAIDVADRLKRLYAGRKDLAWGLQRLAEHEHDIMDAGELLRLERAHAGRAARPLRPQPSSRRRPSACRWSPR